jgi:hypothetical protein
MWMSFPRLKDVEGTWNNLNSLILKQLSGNGATEETVYQYLFSCCVGVLLSIEDNIY